jgi:GNAT superfamily N-acetyltransferase
MDITPIDVFDDAQAAQLFDLEWAVHQADEPDMPPPCRVAHPVSLRRPRPGRSVERRVARANGKIIATASVWLFTIENQHLADASVAVHPGYRRQGIGTNLLNWAVDEAKTAGRRTVAGAASIAVPGGPPRPEAGRLFAAHHGFSLALTEVARRMELGDLSPSVEDELWRDAVARSAGYELVSWVNRTPDEIVDGVAALDSIFLSEAPAGEFEFEDEKIDADRIRANEEINHATSLTVVGTAARHKESGAIVADSVIGVNATPGEHAWQWGTLVDPAHRGHRLGMLVKLANLRLLRETCPKVRWITTGNADVNPWMIAINEQLGFRVVQNWEEYQRHL